MKFAQRDALNSWVGALEALRIMNETPGATLPGLLDELAAVHGERVALAGDGTMLTYQVLAARVNRVARWATAQRLGGGDVVGLLMPNCPDYVAIWLGLTRAGCAVALLNTNLAADALLHCIRVSAATRVIVAGALLPAIAAVTDRLDPEVRVWVHGDVVEVGELGSTWPGQLESELARHDDGPLMHAECALPAPADRALLIYTSGTTGMPKAAWITHARIMEWSFWFAGMMNVQPDDCLYDCLPLYHSTGGVVAIGALLVRGGSVLIRARFSVSCFWDDVVDGGCTIFQYIGELCRYLTAGPPHPRERQHRLRLACGNGLQSDVWTVFMQRFAVPRILEFYAATEGNVSLYNCEGRPGAIGRVPPFLAERFPVALLRCDTETATPLRDESGRYILCGPNEAGEAVGRILATEAIPARRFDGYTDAAASADKVLRDVFAEGDCWFRTGDLMRKDEAGYFTFVDRIGDTFRWKGENVATTEVAAALRAYPGVIDAVAFGVAVPRHEGRAGMAAITVNECFNLSGLHAHLAARLPSYAQPVFLRCAETLDVTGTFKQIKAKLVREGYSDVADPVWLNDRASGRFVACDATVRQAIVTSLRL